MKAVPSVEKLIAATVNALKAIGDSGSLQEIHDKVVEQMQIPEEVVNIPHTKAGTGTRLLYGLAWARTHLKHAGILDNPKYGVWAIVPGKHDAVIDPAKIVKHYQRMLKMRKSVVEDLVSQLEDDDGEDWHDELFTVLTETLRPDAFERLAQRLLRECGFVEVHVTGKSGDGGIDGTGIAKVNDLLSIHVIFQCKRYKSAVTAHNIRDFRGAMAGRTDKGLFITTSTFTRDAKREATRDGVAPIDLIDGTQLMGKLKELRLGISVETETVEKVTIDKTWYKKI